MNENKLGRFELNKIYNEDCYKAIKEIPDKSIDCIITDPPYEIEVIGGNTNIGKGIKNMTNQLEDLDIINGIDLDLLEQFIRVMKKVNIYIWCNKKQIPDYLDFFVKKYKCSFEIMCWIKPNPTPLCGGNYLIDKEFCLYFRKGIKLNTTFESAFTYWNIKKNVLDKERFEHPTIKPLKIIETLVSNSTNENEIILDTFMGSGTTAVAVKNIGGNRKYLGFEISKKYYDIANDRLNGIQADGQMSFFIN